VRGGRSFAERQGIRAFAGVPLIARGTLLGVLCVNYRTERDFDTPDANRRKALVDVFAQQTSSVIASGQLAREQERNRLEAELHNMVKSAALAVLNQCRDALQASLENDSGAVVTHLVDLERAAQGVLSLAG
jgi:GAF domain-containing protein